MDLYPLQQPWSPLLVEPRISRTPPAPRARTQPLWTRNHGGAETHRMHGLWAWPHCHSHQAAQVRHLPSDPRSHPGQGATARRMTAQHQHPMYRKNARLVRQQVTAARSRGQQVTCWRCGWDIDPEQRYDVGHMNGTSHALSNLAPEHRGENRRAGGRQGAAIVNRKRSVTTRMLNW